MAKIKTKLKAEAGPAKAVHFADQGEERHIVDLGNLRVFIVRDGQFWFAQGLEIDYAAQGDTIEQAKRNFENGLESTIDLHLRMHGNIEGLLQLAPSEVLQEAVRNRESIKLFGQVSIHETGTNSRAALPFGGIDYLVSGEAA